MPIVPKNFAKKVILIVLDGAADRMIWGTTPLASARTPNLNKLAAGGINGIMDPIAIGVRPTSDTAHLALLGYDPYKYYRGRGPFEAAGVGIDVREGDIAFRCNFATVENNVVIDRRAGRIYDTDELASTIESNINVPGVKIIFKRSTGYRAVLVIRGAGLSNEVTDTDPNNDGLEICECRAKDSTSESRKTAEIVNSVSRQVIRILDKHPVNIKRMKNGLHPGNAILIRGAGIVPELPSFGVMYGLKGAVIAVENMIVGIGRMCGMDHLPIMEKDAISAGSMAAAKLMKAVKSSSNYDFILVNIMSADEAGHDGDFEKKKAFIESIDDAFASFLTLEDTLVIITMDHSTPVALREHSADPVPILIFGPGVRVDDVKEFNELVAYKGGLLRIQGKDIMPIVLDLINKTEKFGS